MERVVVTAPVFDSVRARLEGAGAAVVGNAGPEPWGREALHGALAGASGALVFMTDRVDAAFLEAGAGEAGAGLRVIGCALKGWDNVDLAACTARGVLVAVVEDLLTAPTAELAVGLMIAAGRQVVAADRAVRAEGFRGWRPRFYGVGLDGSVVGIVGMGAVGRAVAARLQGFGCRVVHWDRERAREGWMPLEELLGAADYVVLALPLTAETAGLIGAAALGRMRPGAVLVNPARGSLVDEAAVAAALGSGRLAAYAADVFECEDWARERRPGAVHPGLLGSGRTVLTPHIGSAVATVRERIELAAAEAVLAGLRGDRPEGCLNWEGVCAGRRGP